MIFSVNGETTGIVDLKISLKNELEGKSTTLLSGKFKVEKFRDALDLPNFQNNSVYYVNRDWNLPIGYIYPQNRGLSERRDYQRPPDSKAHLMIGFWLKGDSNTINESKSAAYLYYQGQLVADSEENQQAGKYATTFCEILDRPDGNTDSPNSYCRKEQVLRTLQQATTALRQKLGESLSLIQKFDVPLMQATTSSLEAFKAYTLGREEGWRGNSPDAIPFFKRAIELDPNFASAYAGLGSSYASLDEHDLAVEYTKKAFALRDHASEHERLLLSSRYYHTVTGEMDKAIETLEVWKRSYPRDSAPRNNLGFAYELMGNLEKAAEEYRAAIPLTPLPAVPYQNLARVLLYLDRRGEAKAVFDEAIAKKSESTNLHLWLYEFAFELGDAAAMQHEVEWAAGKPDEARMLWEQSAAALFEGKLARGQELMRRANQLASSHKMKGEVATGTAFLAAQAALFGKCTQAHEAPSVVNNAPGRKATMMLSAALAICGQNAQAKALMEEQAGRSPTDILLNNVELPVVRALIELNDGNSLRAIELLHTTAPYEQAKPHINYIRGMAYLRAGQAAEAASEFQKIAGARGVDPTWPGHALAHLWLARAHALMGDSAKSRKAYEDFFALWKDADADLPLLIDSKKEYQRLK